VFSSGGKGPYPPRSFPFFFQGRIPSFWGTVCPNPLFSPESTGLPLQGNSVPAGVGGSILPGKLEPPLFFFFSLPWPSLLANPFSPPASWVPPLPAPPCSGTGTSKKDQLFNGACRPPPPFQARHRNAFFFRHNILGVFPLPGNKPFSGKLSLLGAFSLLSFLVGL